MFIENSILLVVYLVGLVSVFAIAGFIAELLGLE